MAFKKTQLKTKTTNYILPQILWVFWIFIILGLGLILIRNLSVLHFSFTEQTTSQGTWTWEVIKKPEFWNDETLKKDEKHKINILVAWRWGWSHEAPNLTDSIMLWSINTDMKTISLFSLPRDLYVEYPDGSQWRINWLYAKYRRMYNSEEKWMQYLANKVSEITWEKIDHYVNIDFNGFKKVIDTIDGIEITLENDFVDPQYPNNNWWYDKLEFKKWTHIMNGENALKFARSRHSTSDFDRSLRQQQVIDAIRNKLVSSYLITSPIKIKELYDVFRKYVYTDIELWDIFKLARIGSKKNEYKMLSANLNDSCFYGSDNCIKGGFLYIPQRDLFEWQAVLLIEWTHKYKLNNYDNLHVYTDLIFNKPLLYKENYVVNVFNSTRVNHLAWKLSNDIKRYWFNIPERNSIGNTKGIKYSQSIVYYNNIEENSTTIQVLKQFIKADFVKTDIPKYSKDANAKMEIVIWEDYSNKNKLINF